MIKIYSTNMKAILTFCLATMLMAPCMAQISLDTDDLPQPGSVQISVRVDSLQGIALTPGSAGANVLWDFSYLNPCCGNLQASFDTMVWVNHDNTSNAGIFPLSNIAQKERCYTYHSHITHQNETKCYYNHYISESSGLWYYGFEDPTNVILDAYWNVFPLLVYGDSIEIIARIHIPVSSDSTRVYHIISKSVADGWGTIITPDTTVQIIRITTTEKVYDTLYMNNVITNVHVYLDNYYYRWYAKKTGFPILEINKGFQKQQPPFFQQVHYSIYKYSPTGINENNLSKDIHVFPNPFSSIVTMQLDDGRTLLSFAIYNSIGRKVISIENVSENKININGEMLPAGIYFYTVILNNNTSFSGKLVKY
ncbi:MAG: T9SS C-terminal target domain-containing protein [Bacteroidetes bacterium]|nr:MAG: T9SS C-terminal target domain-containing protein [Bacteroidota bacterium]